MDPLNTELALDTNFQFSLLQLMQTLTAEATEVAQADPAHPASKLVP